MECLQGEGMLFICFSKKQSKRDFKKHLLIQEKLYLFAYLQQYYAVHSYLIYFSSNQVPRFVTMAWLIEVEESFTHWFPSSLTDH